MQNRLAYDAIVAKPLAMALVQNPRIHGIFGDAENLWVQLVAGEPVPELVPAVAIVDGFTYQGNVPTANLVIGIRTANIRFGSTK